MAILAQIVHPNDVEADDTAALFRGTQGEVALVAADLEEVATVEQVGRYSVQHFDPLREPTRRLQRVNAVGVRWRVGDGVHTLLQGRAHA